MYKVKLLKKSAIFIFLLCFFKGIAQEMVYTSKDISINAFVDGTLLTPNDIDKPILTILISDSGPTDRNGNQNFLKNNILKKIAENLAKNGIASFRYDKRIVKQIKNGNVSKNIKFDDFVIDATSVIEYFKNSKAFSKICVIGHGQGSLIGMLAAKDNVDNFISLSGAGKSIDNVIMDQVQKTAPMYAEDATKAFNIMRSGKTTPDYPSALSSIFDIEIQPFMMNWMQYNPRDVIKTLDMPILIINGTKDLQVSVEEAKLLKEASEFAELKIIDKMNHVLFIIDGDDLDNAKAYNESARAISQEMMATIIEFIKR